MDTFFFLANFFFDSFVGAFSLANKTGWIVAPFVLAVATWRIWLYYINTDYLRSLKWVMIEIRLPRDIRRSPLAMELMLNAIHQTGGHGDWYKKYWMGRVRRYVSLEIVSIEGAVHFLIRTPEEFRNTIESYIYAQYPEAEIAQAPDYVDRVTYARDGRWNMFGLEFALTKPDPYPIKTYIDYGVDKNVKEEEKIDPITSTIELLGSLRKGEQAWIQIIARATQKKWQEEGAKEVEKLKKEKAEKAGGEETGFQETKLTRGEKEVIGAIERHSEKLAFDVGIRVIYIAEKDAYRPANNPAMIDIFKQYNSNTLNGFKPVRVTSTDYPWQEYFGFHGIAPYFNPAGNESEKLKRKMFRLFKERTYFYGLNRRTPFVLTTEELATIFHFPGGVSQTPSFGRIESKKSEPPVNLPM